MMSDRPVPFRSMDDFWEKDNGCGWYLDCPEESWLVRDLDTVARVVDKPQEQLEVTAKKLYSILRIEGDFIPQTEMD